jgi:hypothetical protein
VTHWVADRVARLATAQTGWTIGAEVSFAF